MFPTCITTERLILRHWRESDREPFARINADPLVMEFMPRVLSKEESDSVVERIEAHFRQRGFGLCAVELRTNGSFLGFHWTERAIVRRPIHALCRGRVEASDGLLGTGSRHRRGSGDSPSRLHGFRSGRVGILHSASERQIAPGNGEARNDTRSR